MALSQIAYVSAAPGPLEPDEVAALLSQSRRNNVRDDVTGILLASRCGFVQVLEGPALALRALYERIEDDPRHRDIVMLHKGDVRLRAFPECAMAFQQLDGDSLRRLEQSLPYLRSGLCSMLTADAVGMA